MDISGSHRIPAPREAVWAALHDPDVVAACLPGCERFDRVGDGRFEATVAGKVGPIRATYAGELSVSEASRPERFRLSVKGDGGAAGSAKGSGDVTLTEEGDETVVAYQGTVEATGKVGGLGPRLIVGFARQSIEGFFAKFSALVAEGEALGERRPADGPPLTEAPPLAPDEPALLPETAVDVPPLAAGAPTPLGPTPIAPTATPAVPEPEAIAAEGASSGSMTRIMLVAAIVVVAGVAIYWAFLQPPV